MALVKAFCVTPSVWSLFPLGIGRPATFSGTGGVNGRCRSRGSLLSGSFVAVQEIMSRRNEIFVVRDYGDSPAPTSTTLENRGNQAISAQSKR